MVLIGSHSQNSACARFVFKSALSSTWLNMRKKTLAACKQLATAAVTSNNSF